MDFDTEGFSKLRANPLLFALIRSTEPYLDVYADYQTSRIGDQPALAHDLSEVGFGEVKLAAAVRQRHSPPHRSSMDPPPHCAHPQCRTYPLPSCAHTHCPPA